MSGTYPPALRSVLKAVPCLVMCMASSYVFWIATYAFLRHEHDHVPKFSFKSTKLGVFTRQRDDRKRAIFQKMLNYDPNVKALPGCYKQLMR